MKLILICTITLSGVMQAQTLTPATQKRLDDLRQSFESAAARQAGPAYDSALRTLNTKYATALDRFIASNTQAGKLDDAIALRDEKKRVTDALPLPDSDAEAPEVLRPLRSTYRDQLAAIEATRAKSLAPLQDRYLTELAKLQADSTKAGKLEDALAVKAVIDSLRPSADSSNAPGSSSDEPVIAKGTGKTDARAAQAVCEWALANGAVVVTDQGSVGANEKLKAIPNGRFSVREILAESPIQNVPWESVSGLTEITKLSLNVIQPVTADQIKHLTKLSNLNDLRMVGPLTVEALRAFALHPKVSHLQVEQTGSENITEAMPLMAKRFPAAHWVDWSSGSTKTNEAVCRGLINWPRLQMVTTRGDLNDSCVEQLSRIPNLGWLQLLGNGVIAPSNIPKLKKLTFLSTMYGNRHESGLCAAAAKLPFLSALRISMQQKNPADIEPLKLISKLSDLTLQMSETAAPTDDFMPTVGTLKGLTKLELKNSQLTDAGLAHLELLNKLERLDITGSQVTDTGLAAFKKAVPKCKVIR